MYHQYSIKAKLHKPGTRGGQFWVDDKGTIRYGKIPKKYCETLQQREYQKWFHHETVAGRLPKVKKPVDAKKLKDWWETTIWAQADREAQYTLFKGKNPKQPGKNGGNFYYNENGNVIYGDPPEHLALKVAQEKANDFIKKNRVLQSKTLFKVSSAGITAQKSHNPTSETASSPYSNRMLTFRTNTNQGKMRLFKSKGRLVLMPSKKDPRKKRLAKSGSRP